MKLRSQKDITSKIPSGTPPPLMSAEGDANARKLGAGLTFASASSTQKYEPRNKTVDPGGPQDRDAAPLNAYTLHIGEGEAHSEPAADMGISDETIFTLESTNHNPTPILPLMSPEGKRLAAKTAPDSALLLRRTIR